MGRKWKAGESIMRKILCVFFPLVFTEELFLRYFLNLSASKASNSTRKNLVWWNAGFSRVIGSTKRKEKNRTKSANSEKKKVAQNWFKNNEIIKSEKIQSGKDQWDFWVTIFTSHRRIFRNKFNYISEIRLNDFTFHWAWLLQVHSQR